MSVKGGKRGRKSIAALFLMSPLAYLLGFSLSCKIHKKQ
jgi:hypothetical protein